MNPFLVLSFESGRLTEHEAGRIVSRASGAWKKLSGGGATPHPRTSKSLIFWSGFSDAAAFAHDPRGDFAFLVGMPTPSWSTGRLTTAKDVLAAGAPGLEGLVQATLPPLGGCLGVEGGSRALAFTDCAGLLQVYGFQGDGWAGASSSGLLLAAAAGASVHITQAGIGGLVGNLLGEDSLFTDVQRLPAGSRFDLREGKLTLLQPEYGNGGSRPKSFSEAVEVCQSALVKAVAGCLEASPDAALELSGGLDSRLILAAVPVNARKGRRSYTLGFSGTPDVRMADQIAERYGLDHRFVDLAPLETLSPEATVQMCKECTLACDGAANPFSRAVLAWANQRMDSAARFSGQNGEFARGFYYAGQPDAAGSTRRLVETLVNWRITTNQKVDARIFRRDFYEALMDALVSRVETELSGGGRWLDSTDEFYLKHRMGRWVGSDYSAAAAERTILAPFFSPEFIRASRMAPPGMKRGGRLMAGVLGEIDAALADIPLDSGPSPRRLLRPDASTRWLGRLAFLLKSARKIRQRFLGTSRAPVGAEMIHQRFLRSPQRPTLKRVRTLEGLDPLWFEAWDRGQIAPDWVTLGWLLSVEWCLEFLGEGGG